MLNEPQTDQAKNKSSTTFQRASGMGNATSQTSTSRNRKSSAAGNGSTGGDSAAVTGSSAPTHDEIAARARQIYLKKGSPEGRDTENWLEAEMELMRERGSKAVKR